LALTQEAQHSKPRGLRTVDLCDGQHVGLRSRLAPTYADRTRSFNLLSGFISFYPESAILYPGADKEG
jgi:hypothetical protein